MKKKKTRNASTFHPKRKNERLLWAKITCTQEVWKQSLTSHGNLSLWREGTESSSLSSYFIDIHTQGTEANREDMLWDSSLLASSPPINLVSQTKFPHTGRVMNYFHFQDRLMRSQIASFHLSVHHTPSFCPCSCFLLFLLLLLLVTVMFLPPGEEGSSALETLCVRLTVGSLRCPGCFHNYWGHLDQLQGGFTVLQGLAQIQDLGMKRGDMKTLSVLNF